MGGRFGLRSPKFAQLVRRRQTLGEPLTLGVDESHMTLSPRVWSAIRFIAPSTVVALGLFSFTYWKDHRPSSAASAEAASALAQRCAEQMANATCRVTNSSAPLSNVGRTFIAGVGEVDSAAYLELKRQGEAMCADVRVQCQAAWDGPTCRIAKALYPALDPNLRPAN
jgi:hypothetical protein